MPMAKRKALLRQLQVQWHPDKQSEFTDQAMKDLANEVVRMVNDAANVARKMAAKEKEVKEKRGY
eukprot:1295853-Prymnesium_polylepis.1